MSPEAHARLVELDAVSREAREFYDYAAAVLPTSELRERSLRLAAAKAELVALLALRLRGGTAGEMRGLARARPQARRGPASIYAPLRVTLDSPDSPPDRLWRELLGLEAAVAEACRAQAAGSGDADCRRVMAWVLPVLERGRDELAPAGGTDYSV